MNRRCHVSVYTDGSCDGNPGPGGYAAILKCGKFYREVVGSVPKTTTNNRMELMAVIRGLSEVKPNSEVIVYTDSKYIEEAFNSGRVTQWQENGWCRIRTGTEVVNKDAFSILLSTIKDRKLEVKFQKLPGHSGHKLNDRADFLARRAARSTVV